MNEKEKIKAEIKRLYNLHYEDDQKYEKAKGRRFFITILAFTAFYFVVLMLFDGNTSIGDVINEGIGSILASLFVSVIFALIHFFANWTIFHQLSEMGRRERASLEYIEKRIKELKMELERLEEAEEYKKRKNI